MGAEEDEFAAWVRANARDARAKNVLLNSGVKSIEEARAIGPGWRYKRNCGERCLKEIVRLLGPIDRSKEGLAILSLSSTDDLISELTRRGYAVSKCV